MRIRKSGLAVTAAAASVLVAGCAPEEREAGWTGVVDTVEGTAVVRNPQEPLYGPDRVVLDTVWRTAGPSESDTAPVWQEPRFIGSAPGGVYVLDSRVQHVHRLDGATGEWIGYIGQQGGGPGELLRPVGVAPWQGALGVLDAGHRAVERFAPDGSYLGKTSFNALPFSFYPMGDSIALMRVLGRETDQVLLTGDTLTPYVPGAPVAAEGALLDQCERFMGVPDRVVSYSCVVPYLKVHDRSGVVLREVTLVGLEATPRPQAEIDAFIEEIRPAVAGTGMPAQQVDEFLARQREENRYRRAMRFVRWDRAHNRYVLLEQESEDFGGGLPTFHVFRNDGVYLARFNLPQSVWDFDFVDGDLVALVRDADTGVVSAARYSVSLPGEESG